MEREHHHDLLEELADVVRILDQCLRNDINDGVDNGVCDGSFDVQNVQVQDERATRQK